MPSNEDIIRNLYVVAEKEPKRFRSLLLVRLNLVRASAIAPSASP